MEGHWELYGKLIRETKIPAEKIVEVLGNHDCWGALSFKDFAVEALLHRPLEDWFSRTVEADGVRVVTFMPFRFPAGRAVYDFVIPIQTEMLDALEEELEKKTEAGVTVVASHFPTAMMFPLKTVRSTKTKRNLLEILADPKYRIAAYINGHTHPQAEFDTMHYPGFIEITAGAILERDGVQVLSIDNGRIGYVRMVPGEAELAIVTSPGSDRLSSRVFPDENFEIRVVSFSEAARDFRVTGAVEGTLVSKWKLASGATLWGLNVSLGKGHYTIKFEGDLNREVNFTVGIPINSFKEWVFFELFGAPFCYSAVTLLGVCVIAVVSFLWLPSSLNALFSHFIEYLNGGVVKMGLSLCFLWALWPAFVGYAIRKLPTFPRYYAIFLLLSGFLLPFGTTVLEGRLCLQTTFGYYVDGHFVYDVGAQLLGFFYLNGVILPSIAILARFSLVAPRRAEIDLFVTLTLFFVVVYHWESLGRDTTVNWTPLRVSLGFHIMPLVTLGTYSALRRMDKAQTKTKTA
jgi:hypothetical protein